MISFLILLGAMSSLLTLSRRLPAQNLAAIAVIILSISGGIEFLAVKTGFPFPTLTKYEAVFRVGILPWPVPFCWLLLLLLARNLAQFSLRFWRSSPSYGFWLQGVSAFLTAVSWLVWEAGDGIEGDAAYFLVRFLISLGLLILIFPWTLDKRKR